MIQTYKMRTESLLTFYVLNKMNGKFLLFQHSNNTKRLHSDIGIQTTYRLQIQHSECIETKYYRVMV